jgi:hypothetical protein
MKSATDFVPTLLLNVCLEFGVKYPVMCPDVGHEV